MHLLMCLTWINLRLRSTNERWRYDVTSSLIGWAHAPCAIRLISKYAIYKLPQDLLQIRQCALLTVLGQRYTTRPIYMYYPRGRFKNSYALLNLRALKFSHADKIYIIQSMGKIFVSNFEGTLRNSTQNIWPKHWKICFFYTTLKFESS